MLYLQLYNQSVHRWMHTTLAGGKIKTVRRSKFSAGVTVYLCPPTPIRVTELRTPFLLATKKVKTLTAAEVRELLVYEPNAGTFVWKVSTGRFSKSGSSAGRINNKGYSVIQIHGKPYLAHRLAWLISTGQWPSHQIDHINGVKADNRRLNLRECTNAQNGQNISSHSDSASKYLGVNWMKSSGRWQARIMVDGRSKYLGLFHTEEAAFNAYCKAKAELHSFNPLPRNQ